MDRQTSDGYQLYYWPHIQGRGEFIRLLLEEAGAEYVDVGRLSEERGGGIEPIREILQGEQLSPPHFAPPILRDGDLVISQTANICLHLATRHGLAGDDERDRLHANQIQLTLQDLLTEAHDTHHPISVGEYYEDQKEAAARRAAAFRAERMPKFFGYLERAAAPDEASGSPHMVGDQFTYADLSAFQLLRGLTYAFPNAFAELESTIPHLLELADAVASRDRIAAYLASERRIDFNEQGIFRHYPELDA